jgi:hypothetical protein
MDSSDSSTGNKHHCKGLRPHDSARLNSTLLNQPFPKRALGARLSMLTEEGLYGTAPQLHTQPQQQDLLIVPLNGTGGSQDHLGHVMLCIPAKQLLISALPPEEVRATALEAQTFMRPGMAGTGGPIWWLLFCHLPLSLRELIEPCCLRAGNACPQLNKAAATRGAAVQTVAAVGLGYRPCSKDAHRGSRKGMSFS